MVSAGYDGVMARLSLCSQDPVLSAGTSGAILGERDHRHGAAVLTGVLLAITAGLIALQPRRA
jgi:hypothetical protein